MTAGAVASKNESAMASRMDNPKENRKPTGKKVRVSFRRNRGDRPRQKDWNKAVRENEDQAHDAETVENVVAKGSLSRRRTILVSKDDLPVEGLLAGTVVAVRGLYCEVDDGLGVRPCTVRRVLRTRTIRGRNPVAVGDRVKFKIEALAEGVVREGVIHSVEPRRSELNRRTGKRMHTMAANVDQAIIVTSAQRPLPKPHLIDRYIVAAHAGGMTPMVCMNKIDLDETGEAAALLDRFQTLGYAVLATSAVRGDGIDELRALLKDKSSVVAGQSGVGKSSLLNAVQPGLQLNVGEIIEQIEKGRHTTTTATLIKLDMGGYVVDTPGVRTFDLSLIAGFELEAFFKEFVDLVPMCKFPDCTHTHEEQCAVKQAVEDGRVHVDRYASYVQLFEEASPPGWKDKPR